MTTHRKLRSFRAKLLDDNNDEFIGHFTGTSPSQAGRKAISSLLNKKTGTVKFMIKEITKETKNNNKIYTYQGTRKKKDNIVSIERNGVAKPIVYKYDTHIKAIR
jgi:hypothetical protein